MIFSFSMLFAKRIAGKSKLKENRAIPERKKAA